MIRYKCTVEYCGAKYCGWQSQRHGDSVQEQIESALELIIGVHTPILAAGRTDAKVNAWGQVFQFDTDRDMSERKWQGAINGFLPGDIHIRKVEKVSHLFHARYCVRDKRYDYRINLGEYNVFRKDAAYQCPYPVNVGAMKQGAQYLIGTHDFTSFNSNSLKETPDQVRTIESISFSMEGEELVISYRGRGFLRYMVRMMTAALLECGRGRMKPEQIQILLEARSKTVARRNAKPEGLTLMEVNYFEVIAETNQSVVREFLPEDGDQMVPGAYAFAGRHEERLYGEFRILEEEAVLETDAEHAEEAEQLVPQLEISAGKPCRLVIHDQKSSESQS
ncbi:tRNA pseudouridine(38-40) synthase TruA [Anaerolactibacter massiliensis]|uniref:tRNA pseudouridine(38-40) synthase TruA n=1 Tax=Anaerolactibacter massiliensis TaxID=2044573 RepID=UPI000CFA4A18|nr:tRNA pseudouridine(38-40) synthase TruA [Anaerolactibacter massiliensis]MDD7679282.1 tRNA pseudouridine(38-40) synthase TruA [Stecheria intestinalis]MDY3234679.1 tRNA pseudouridine(38-40) synthase TruA [Erysipelotrichaceae bacterium]MDY4681569.1 tRNA pseudouridine(38-40) synthase TruA [Lachnospiraceae bacterium]